MSRRRTAKGKLLAAAANDELPGAAAAKSLARVGDTWRKRDVAVSLFLTWLELKQINLPVHPSAMLMFGAFLMLSTAGQIPLG